jgi:hypothetical protein
LDKVDLNKQLGKLKEKAGKSLDEAKDLDLGVGKIDSFLTTFFEGDASEFEADFLNDLLGLSEEAEDEEEEAQLEEEESDE